MIKKIVACVVLIVCIVVILPVGFVTFQPEVNQMKSCMTTSMFQVRLCSEDENYTPLSKISDYLQAAVLIAEDSSFYKHQGFDWKQIKKSMETNIKQKRFARGGSTITQQLAKNVFLSKDKTIVRKLREAYLAWRIEQNFTKKEILEKYLNVIQFGPNIYGIKQAANHYFEKSPSDLDLLESLFLAYLLPNPINYSRSFNKKLLSDYARSRIKKLLVHLYKFKKITRIEYDTALYNMDTFLLNEEVLPVENFEFFETEKEERKEFEEPFEEVTIDPAEQPIHQEDQSIGIPIKETNTSTDNNEIKTESITLPEGGSLYPKEEE